jgi:hypothetical protein
MRFEFRKKIKKLLNFNKSNKNDKILGVGMGSDILLD